MNTNTLERERERDTLYSTGHPIGHNFHDDRLWALLMKRKTAIKGSTCYERSKRAHSKSNERLEDLIHRRY